MHFTILGSRGFIGSHLISFLEQEGVECVAPAKDERLNDGNLGHVVYCIGLTSDFRTRAFDTVESHVCVLSDILKSCRYDSFLYLSSARVYKNAQSTKEETALTVSPHSPDDMYNISKIMGESLCLTIDNPSVRVARISNVIGLNASRNNFVDALIAEALENHKILLQTSLESEKDYIAIESVVDLLPRIAQNGCSRIYNVASGINMRHESIVNIIAELISCNVEVQKSAPSIIFPSIDVSRISDEFHVLPCDIKKSIERIIEKRKKEKVI